MEVTDKELLTDTPIVAVDLDVLEQNISWLSNLAKEVGVKLRPHAKTHKSPYVAKKQLDAGAIGITTAKLGEAEVMVDNGINDILIAFPIIGKRKLERFGQLLKRANLMVALDDLEIARSLNEVGEKLDKEIEIYADVDTGLHRMGRSPIESVDHLYEISKLSHITIKGLMSHTGHAYQAETDEEIRRIAIEDATLLNQTKEMLAEKGVFIPEISIGATATARFIKEIPFVTEMRPGMYVFNDRFVMASGGAKEENCAVSVFATVISHPTNDRIIIDAGSKTLAQDPFKHGGHGVVKGHDNLVISSLSEEHGTIVVRGNTNLNVGDVIQIIPNHICPVINLTDNLYGFRNGELERMIPVLGRGKNR
ncbi:alanine racemase [Aquibacillus saliphilus]|uniref:alanine racemase n=1 Tax=Aquibacillus saliphilus TaxID=1909422 RepID=UPI001CEFBE7C|nr:alanine racemase [Aquibacillus saliphilus]